MCGKAGRKILRVGKQDPVAIDLSADPFANDPLAATPGEAAALESFLARQRERAKRFRTLVGSQEDPVVRSEDAEALRALGYLE